MDGRPMYWTAVHFNVANRRIHYWASFAAAIPILVILVSGILLQLKKQWDWVQPPERRGTSTVPSVQFDRILEILKTDSRLGVTDWDDIDRLDVRPGRGVVKVTTTSRWEAQIDLGSGALLQSAYRRSDLIESIHDGSIFAGDWTKLGVFLPAGIVLLLLWISGIWMIWVPLAAKRRRRGYLSKAAALAFFTTAAAKADLLVEPATQFLFVV